MQRHALSLLLVLLSLAVTNGQTQSRLATTRTLLLKHTLFFHSRTVAFAETPRLSDGVWKLPADEGKTLAVVFRTAPTTDGPVEIRGTFVDVGRFAPDDSRIGAYLLQPIVDAVTTRGAWPARDTVFAIVNATAQPIDDPRTTSLRALAMFPERFDGKPVTLRGRFRGRNLMGDLPTWPRQSQTDFVLQAADAAIWVTGVKPKGKGFDLDPSARRDLGRWLEVTGTMSVVEGLPMLRATAIAQASPEDEGPLADDRPAAPALPPPSINFSVPTDGEDDIPTNKPVLVQFSRDMKAESFDGRVRVTATINGEPTAVPAFTTTYRANSLAVEIKFATPLPRFAKIVVEFVEGIVTPDGVALAPAKITFTTGGSR